MIESLFSILNNNRFFNGIMNILLHIGGKYVSAEIPYNLEKVFENQWIRRFFIFSVAYISTRDIKIAILLTLIFIFVFKYLLNDKSQVYILNKNLDNNKKNEIITSQELLKAKNTIDRYNKMLENQKIKY